MPSYPVVEAAGARPPIARAPTGILGIVGRFAHGETDVPIRVTSPQEALERLGPATGEREAALALAAYLANGGQVAYAVRVDPDAGEPDGPALLGSAAEGTGLHALAGRAEVDVVCLPDACHLADDEAGALYRSAAEMCEAQRWFLLVDATDGLRTVPELAGWVGDRGLRHRNAALYSPRVVLAGAEGGATRVAPSSGAVAGVYARTDAARGVWKAPAGIEATLLDVVGLERELSHAEREALPEAGINVLRRLPEQGEVVWGARTLVGDDDPEWRYVAVRRTALMIERSLVRGLSWTEQEANDESTWAAVRTAVDAFLDALWRAGALQGDRPDRASFVRCGVGQTMTADDVRDGVLVVEVGVALVRPAEFIVLRVRLPAAAGRPAVASPPAEGARRPFERLQPPVRRPAPTRGRRIAVTAPAGTGRTAAARALAGDLGLRLFRIDLSEVVSRYIGETEKNLSRVLDRATSVEVVLFFDEADALFGSRTQVRDAHDRYANAAGLLARWLAGHPGPVVVATRDVAVLRRAGVDIDAVVTAEDISLQRDPDGEKRRR